jgi:hypothetical protein
MSKRFLLTENEINEIRGLYGLINEVAKAINASTSPERMPNFIGQGNKNSYKDVFIRIPTSNRCGTIC